MSKHITRTHAEFILIMLILFLSAMAVAPKGKCEVVVFVDDFSAAYSIVEQHGIIEILTKHDTKATLFVIPNHNLKAPISLNPEFSELILESDLPLGMHGYQHYMGEEGTEFQFLSGKEAGELIDKGNQEFQLAFGKGATIFRAPSYLINREARKAVVNRGMRDATFLAAHEYTWYLEEENKEAVLKEARSHLRRDCKILGHYILAAHVRAANNPAGIEFLDSFLGGIDREKHEFVELEDFLS